MEELAFSAETERITLRQLDAGDDSAYAQAVLNILGDKKVMEHVPFWHDIFPTKITLGECG
jgi:hypothetical protein